MIFPYISVLRLRRRALSIASSAGVSQEKIVFGQEDGLEDLHCEV